MRSSKQNRFHPHTEVCRVLRDAGLSPLEIGKRLELKTSRVNDLLGVFPDSPSVDEWMKHHKTRAQKAATANLYMMTCMVLRRPIPKHLEQWHNLKITNPVLAASIRSKMMRENADPAAVNFYVLDFLCPGLMVLEKQEVWNSPKKKKARARGDEA